MSRENVKERMLMDEVGGIMRLHRIAQGPVTGGI